MRVSKASDAWRNIKNLSRYKNRVSRLTLRNVSGITTPLEIDFVSGMTVICGKNGAGKTTLLKSIVYAMNSGHLLKGKHKHAQISAEIFINNSVITEEQKISLGDSLIKYIEPSIECSRINSFLSSTTNYEEMLEGVEPNPIFGNKKNLDNISQIVGKNYKKISIYEIEGAIDGISFPYVVVSCDGEIEYDNLSMGMGEFVCIYLYWYLNFIGKNKILLIEEFENFISAYSQVRLMDYLALVSSESGIWTILSSHSEHVINKLSLDNIRILYTRNHESKIVVPKHAGNYLQALGVTSEKKGAYLVEDKVANIVLKALINKYDPELLRDRQIVGLRCDSNLEKIIKHYEPHDSAAQSYSLIAVFDADQRDKIANLKGKFVGVTCLPAREKVAPEVELWTALSDYSELISMRLGISDNEDLLMAISTYESDDHHDRLYSVSSTLSVGFELLVSNIMNVWCENNYISALRFILSLKFSGSLIRVEDFLLYIKSITETPASDVLSEYTELHKDTLCYIGFDGVNLKVIVAD